VADLLLGEPPLRPHPVSAYGGLMERVETLAYADDRARGVLHASGGVGGAALAGAAVRSTVVATAVAAAGHGLRAAAGDVADALAAGDLAGARTKVRALVGRDTAELGEAEIARAVVESVAENTVDAVVAPALAGAIGGAAGAFAYRAINTLDSTVGHRSPRYLRYGWASARLDDLANWVPARVTAALVVAVRPGSAAAVWRAIREDAPAHPSPNAGVAEAAFAAAHGLSLGGPNRYGGRVEHRGGLGRGRPAAAGDVAGANRLSRDVTVALAALLAVAGVLP
ncbi:MAG: adenosylcobinamide-phosphate synthase CbiB, partial [Acidimicrobiales bacterium]